MPYMAGIGNHEQDHLSGGSKDPSGAPGEGWHPWWGNFGDDSGGECGVPMYYRFHMPDNGNAVWWYVYWGFLSVKSVVSPIRHYVTKLFLSLQLGALVVHDSWNLNGSTVARPKGWKTKPFTKTQIKRVNVSHSFRHPKLLPSFFNEWKS